MKFLKALAFITISLLLFFVVVGLFLPTHYEVSRSLVINAPAAAIHPLVNDLDRWDEWEPWSEDDSTIRVTPGPVRSGAGASQKWTSKGGDGMLTFIATDANTGVEYDVLFDNRFTSKATIRYEPAAQGTMVTWLLVGGDDAPAIIGGYFALLMDSMLGPKYELGLKKLKAAAEKG